MKYYTGGSSAYELIYYNVGSIGDQISGYPTGVSPDVNDTWAVHVKYTASGQQANQQGYTYSQSPNNGGSGYTSGTYYAVYSGICFSSPPVTLTPPRFFSLSLCAVANPMSQR